MEQAMTTFITEFVNASATQILLADDAMAESFCLPAGAAGNPQWAIGGAKARQAIRKPGHAAADLIWDDGDRNIMILRAGAERPQVLARLKSAGVCGIALSYDDLGEIHAFASEAAQARAAELAF
jgi:hypothetical protein